MTSGRISIPELTSDEVLLKCDYFTRVQLWPTSAIINPKAWLTNFLEHELPFAIQLLNSFFYFSEPIVTQLFIAAFQNISTYLEVRVPGPRLKSVWQRFCQQAIVSYVEGEPPGPTDSGHIFARLTRDLGIAEPNILRPAEAVRELLIVPTRPLILVDDFVGSGEQFISFLKQVRSNGKGGTTSFAEIIASTESPCVFYCFPIGTEQGILRIQSSFPKIKISTSHKLIDRYNVFHPDSLVWPDALRSGALDFLQEASARALIPNTNGKHSDDWQGYRKLGLTIAFNHGVPDATIPLYRWKSNGWRPLFSK